MTGIRDEPMCPVCCLYVSNDYLYTHLKIDHTAADVARALSIVVMDDFAEWAEELQKAKIVTPQE